MDFNIDDVMAATIDENAEMKIKFIKLIKYISDSKNGISIDNRKELLEIMEG